MSVMKTWLRTCSSVSSNNGYKIASNKILDVLGFKETTIPEQKEYEGQVFPLVVQPGKKRSIEEWSESMKKNQASLTSLVRQYGAILFKGFPVADPECFDKFSGAFGWENFPYLGGPGPRKHITGNVYSANEAPPDKYLQLHHEMRYQNHTPNWVFFYCEVPPTEGGQTPVAMSFPIYDDMIRHDPGFVEKLEKEGLYFTRVQPGKTDDGSVVGASWQSSYFTDDKKKAEQLANSHGCTIEWLEDDCARISAKIAAFAEDPFNQKKTWFNNAHAFYTSYDNKWNVAKNTIFFGNGEEMPPDTMNILNEVMESHAVDYEWDKGHVIVIDNNRAMHTRRTFKPPRRVLASLWK